MSDILRKLNETISYEIDLETSTITFTSEKKDDEIPTVDAIIDQYKIENVIIGENITSIGAYAFYACSSLTTIEMSNVERINKFAFAYCQYLTTVNISNVIVISIGDGVFEGCYSLEAVDAPNVKRINL